jgi:hypothetical protein
MSVPMPDHHDRSRLLLRRAALEFFAGLVVLLAWTGCVERWWGVGALGADGEMAMLRVLRWCESTDGTVAHLLGASVLMGLAALHLILAVRVDQD